MAPNPIAGNQVLNLHLVNLTAQDVQFLQDLVQLFCDPNQSATRDKIRSGDLLIACSPETGHATVGDANNIFAFALAEAKKEAKKFRNN